MAASSAAPSGGRQAKGWWRKGHTLGEKLSPLAEQQLARALATHAVAFSWQRGDVLLIDNARMLHDGLPGFGPRRLKVALLGGLRLPQSQHRLHEGIFDETGRAA